MRRFGLLVLVLGLLGVVLACETDAKGIDACRRIEEARCRRAPSCAVALTPPVPSGDEVEACVRYYRDACLHGLTVEDPGEPSVAACEVAIATGDCAYVTHPEYASQCSWLIPPVVVIPAEASTDVAVEVQAMEAGTPVSDAMGQ